jgi:hypothetical protein
VSHGVIHAEKVGADSRFPVGIAGKLIVIDFKPRDSAGERAVLFRIQKLIA